MVRSDLARLRNLMLALVTVGCLGFTGFVAYSLIYRPDLYRVPIGGSFALFDVEGRQVTDADFLGQYVLVYFGYTHCPDLCPTALADMTGALGILEEREPQRAALVVPLFVTLDPARDTREHLGDYITHFHPRFVALTGPEERIAAMSSAYNVTYRRVVTEDGQDYFLDHTAYIFLIGPDGRYVTHFTPKEDAASISRRLAELVE